MESVCIAGTAPLLASSPRRGWHSRAHCLEPSKLLASRYLTAPIQTMQAWGRKEVET